MFPHKPHHLLALVALCLFLLSFRWAESEADRSLGYVLLGLSAVLGIVAIVIAAVAWYRKRRRS